jgi:hypothetical protein
VLAGGIEPYDLPAPYQRLQHRTLANKRSVAALLRDVASLVLGQDPFPSEEEIQAITGEIEAIQKVADSQRRWATVKPSLIVEASDGSPYNIEHLLQMADKRMVVIGQNLHWLSQTRECHDRIMRFLSDKPGRSFDIVICDADNEKAVEALSTVNPSMEIDDNTYFHHLKAATARFLAFRDRCHRDGVGTLTIHVRALIPFGATVIDPEGPDGLIVLQPLINHGPKAAERPQFPISKATNNRVFSYYWRCFDTLLNFGRRL